MIDFIDQARFETKFALSADDAKIFITLVSIIIPVWKTKYFGHSKNMDGVPYL